MTVDNLREIYNIAFSRVPESSGLLAQQNAGIKAVVLALRDPLTNWVAYLHQTGAMDALTNVERDYVWAGTVSTQILNEILGSDAGEKAEFSANTGEENDGCIQEAVSFINPRRSTTVGESERYGNKLAHTAHASAAGTGDCAGKDETGRSRNVGGESNHRLNEKVAGGPTREDGRKEAMELTHTIATGPSTPAADPSPAVCVWLRADKSKLLGVQWWSVGCVVGLKREDQYGGSCPSCGKPIVFTEAK